MYRSLTQTKPYVGRKYICRLDYVYYTMMNLMILENFSLLNISLDFQLSLLHFDKCKQYAHEQMDTWMNTIQWNSSNV